MLGFLKEQPLVDRYAQAIDAEYEPLRDDLSLAGLDENELRNMDPDDQVAALEQTQPMPS